MIEHSDAANLNRFVREAVSDKVDFIAIDEWRGFDCLRAAFPHETAKYSAGEYVRPEFHTQNIDPSGACSSVASLARTIHADKKYCRSASLSYSSSITTGRTPTSS
jgi:hypothetical protein